MDYYLSAHGEEIGNFKLPSNIRIVMMCSNGEMTACPENEFRLWNSVISNKGFGRYLDNLGYHYGLATPNQTKIKEHSLCVFSPNMGTDNKYLRKKKI